MNHSCNPSCLGYGIDFELAVRDIHLGEELTSDYATFNLLNQESFVCRCASPQCRMWVNPNDVIRLAERWTTLESHALRFMQAVPQPLWVLMQEEYVDKADQQLSCISRR